MYFNKMFLFLFLLLIVVCSVSAVSASDVQDDYSCDVNNTFDCVFDNFTDEFVTSWANGSDVGVYYCNGSSFRDIQSTVDEVPDKSVIVLSGNYSHQRFDANEVFINKSIILVGSATIDAHNLHRIFKITSDDVIISSLRLINGRDVKGSAIYLSNCNNVIISNCTFEHNCCGFHNHDLSGYGNSLGHFIDMEHCSNIFVLGNPTNFIDDYNFDFWDSNLGRAFHMHKVDINTVADFKNVASDLNQNYYDYFVINFKPNTVFNLIYSSYVADGGLFRLFKPNSDNVIFNGNGAKVIGGSSDLTFLFNEKSNVIINDLTISGFNSAIINYANLLLNNTVLKENDFNQKFSQFFNGVNLAGALSNYGSAVCVNSSFISNGGYSNGVAISTFQFSSLTIADCIFKDNEYRCGSFSITSKYDSDEFKDIYLDNDAILTVVNNKTTQNFSLYNEDCALIKYRSSLNPVTRTVNVTNVKEFNEACKLCRDYKNYDSIVFNLTSSNYVFKYEEETFVGTVFGYLLSAVGMNNKKEFLTLLKPLVNVVIYGNGATIKISNPKDSYENHFLVNNLGQNSVILYNLTISGFNTAIVNNGILSAFNCSFINNKVDYIILEDYGGAIYNTGKLWIQSCVFKDNYAKYGGAIYNKGGVIYFAGNNIMTNNHAYKEGSKNSLNDVVGKDSSNIYNCEGKIIYTDSCNYTFDKVIDDHGSTEIGNFVHVSSEVLIFAGLSFIMPVIGGYSVLGIVTGFVIGCSPSIISIVNNIIEFQNHYSRGVGTVDGDSRSYIAMLKHVGMDLGVLIITSIFFYYPFDYAKNLRVLELDVLEDELLSLERQYITYSGGVIDKFIPQYLNLRNDLSSIVNGLPEDFEAFNELLFLNDNLMEKLTLNPLLNKIDYICNNLPEGVMFCNQELMNSIKLKYSNINTLLNLYRVQDCSLDLEQYEQLKDHLASALESAVNALDKTKLKCTDEFIRKLKPMLFNGVKFVLNGEFLVRDYNYLHVQKPIGEYLGIYPLLTLYSACISEVGIHLNPLDLDSVLYSNMGYGVNPFDEFNKVYS